MDETLSSGDYCSAICCSHLGPFGIAYYGANQERSWLEIKAQFHVQARFVHSLQCDIFQPQVEDSLQAGKHSPVLVKNSSGDRQRVLIASIHLTKLEFLSLDMGNYGEVYSVRALEELRLAFDG
jgi:hypothetical protein